MWPTQPRPDVNNPGSIGAIKLPTPPGTPEVQLPQAGSIPAPRPPLTPGGPGTSILPGGNTTTTPTTPPNSTPPNSGSVPGIQGFTPGGFSPDLTLTEQRLPPGENARSFSAQPRHTTDAQSDSWPEHKHAKTLTPADTRLEFSRPVRAHTYLVRIASNRQRSRTRTSQAQSPRPRLRRKVTCVRLPRSLCRSSRAPCCDGVAARLPL